MGCPGYAEHCIVNMIAVRATAGIAIETRGQHLQRKGGCHEAVATPEALEDQIANLNSQRIIRRELLIVLGIKRDMTGG